MARPTAMVTGASSGIGLELARILAEHGYDLNLISRDPQRLAQAAEDLKRQFHVNITAVARDLSDPKAAQEIFDQLARDRIEIDILINNAGFGGFGKFYEVDLQNQLDMIQVNITALTHLTGLFLRDMVARRRGRILNIASTAAFQPGPLMAVYYASKAYVLSFSEALANEVKGSGVTITTLCPGPTRTRFQSVAGIEESRLIKAGRIMDARTVAMAGFRGLMKGKLVVIPGLLNKVLACAVRFAPRGLLLRMIRWIQDTRNQK